MFSKQDLEVYKLFQSATAVGERCAENMRSKAASRAVEVVLELIGKKKQWAVSSAAFEWGEIFLLQPGIRAGCLGNSYCCLEVSSQSKPWTGCSCLLPKDLQPPPSVSILFLALICNRDCLCSSGSATLHGYEGRSLSQMVHEQLHKDK